MIAIEQTEDFNLLHQYDKEQELKKQQETQIQP